MYCGIDRPDPHIGIDMFERRRAGVRYILNDPTSTHIHVLRISMQTTDSSRKRGSRMLTQCVNQLQQSFNYSYGCHQIGLRTGKNKDKTSPLRARTITDITLRSMREEYLVSTIEHKCISVSFCAIGPEEGRNEWNKIATNRRRILPLSSKTFPSFPFD